MIKILIVDSDNTILSLAKRVLSDKYEVVSASDDDEAIDVFDREDPDMLLTDFMMSGMNGIELRAELQRRSGRAIPTLFMTSDTIAEPSMDEFINKPFEPQELLEKVETVFNNGDVAEKFSKACASGNGALMLVKLVSREAPEKSVVDGFENALKKALMPDDMMLKTDTIYKLFVYDMVSDSSAEEFIEKLDDQVSEISNGKVGCCAGVVFAPEHGTDLAELSEFADKCLKDIEAQKHTGCLVFSPFDQQPVSNAGNTDLQMLSQMFEEHSMVDSAFVIETEAFSYVYRFLLRYIQSYSSSAYKLLVTLSPLSDGFDEEPITEVTDAFGDMVAHSLRKSDIMVRTNDNQYLIILPEITETDTERLVKRLLRKWNTLEKSRFAEVTYEAEAIIAEKHQREHRRNVRATDEDA